jgi:micrococcal nuclease
VVRVIDGDSIVVLQGETKVYVQLVEIDAPELDQPFGQKAADQLRVLIKGRRVRVAERGKDRYGRILAEVFSIHGLSLNFHLIETGRAWWYKKYVPGCISCEHAQKKTRIKGLGFWGGERRPVPPWQWRRGLRSRGGEYPPTYLFPS